MGTKLSKPLSSEAPAQRPLDSRNTPLTLTEPSTQDVTAIGAHLDQQLPVQTRNKATDISPRTPASRHGSVRRPSSSPFNEHEQDATTCTGSESPASPKITTRGSMSAYKRQFSIDSIPYETHPFTQKKVFRKGWFGDKQAVQIVCEELRQVLQRVVTAMPSAGENEKLFSPSSWITEPFEVVVHNKGQLLKHHSELEDCDAKKHLEWFLERLGAHQPGLWQKQEEVLSGNCRQVLFKHLWLLYPPGSTSFSLDDGMWRAYIVERSECVMRDSTTTLQIHACYLDFDQRGQRLIPFSKMIEVASYISERQVGALRLKPDWYIEQTNPHILPQLVERGREYFRFGKTPHHLAYDGDAWPETSQDFKHRVIVDYSTRSRYIAIDQSSDRPEEVLPCAFCTGKSIGLFPYPEEANDEPQTCANGIAHPSNLAQATHDSHAGEESLLLCPPRLWAFSLKFKTWKPVSHHELSDIEPQDATFEQDLCMKRNRKSMLGLIVSGYMEHMNDSRLIDSKEIVARKGRGLNILLAGRSGTGKTMTAESLAEKVNAPLYTMNSGDLGIEANSFDCKLQETFTRAKNWNAMVLLDDADIYIYQREPYSVKRNVLLPILLRHLEYSDCLAFITVCHRDDIDPAFSSRINVSITFPNFDFGTQQNIWRRVIDRLPSDCLGKDNLEDFIHHELGEIDHRAYQDMNGRQIRNCIDVALVLARKETPPGSTTYRLEPEHIVEVLRLGKDFKDHIFQEGTEAREHLTRRLFDD